MADKTINEAIEQLEIITEELHRIEDLEKSLVEKETSLAKTLSRLESFQNELTQTMEKMESIDSRINGFVDSFYPLIEKIDNLSKQMDGQLEEAKQLETKFLLEKMDSLIAKAEKMTSNNKQPQPKKEPTNKPNQ